MYLCADFFFLRARLINEILGLVSFGSAFCHGVDVVRPNYRCFVSFHLYPFYNLFVFDIDDALSVFYSIVAQIIGSF